MDRNDLKNAKENIDRLFKLRDDLIQGSPYLSDISSRLDWYEKAISEIPEDADRFFSLLEEPIQSVLSIGPTNLDYSSVTGATGSFYTITADTRDIITEHGADHYSLINEYDDLKKTEELIDEIINVISGMRKDLKEFRPQELLEETKEAYAQWKAGAIDNSALTGPTRAFQDVFKGCLRDAWVSAENAKPAGFSWNKMAASLGNTGGGKKSLLSVKGAEDNFHEHFTVILKKTKTVSREEMERIFKEYIEHLYSVIKFIDFRKMS